MIISTLSLLTINLAGFFNYYFTVIIIGISFLLALLEIKKINLITVYRLSIPLIIIILISTANFFFSEIDSKEYLKDLLPYLRLFALLIIGAALGKYFATTDEKFRNFLLFFATSNAIFFLLITIYNTGLDLSIESSSKTDRIKAILPLVMGLSIASFLKQSLFSKRFLFLIMVGSLSLFFSLSRLSLGIFFISIVIGLYVNRNIAYKSIGIMLPIVGLFFLLSQGSNIEFDNSSFIKKLQSSINEIGYQEGEIRTHNWRGYETFLAAQQFQSNSAYQKLFGEGFGNYIPLPTTIHIYGDAYFDRLNIIHNGYYDILLESGIIGLLFYLFFLSRIIRLRRYGSRLDSMLLISISLTVIVSTLINSGIGNKSYLDLLFIIVGMIIYRINHEQSNYEK